MAIVGVWAWVIVLGSTGIGQSSAPARAASPGMSDTLSVDQRCMVFYTPTAAQRRSYPKSRTAVLDSLSWKFARTQRRVVPFLRKVGITPVTTAGVTFRFGHGDSTVFVRRKSKDLFGVVMFSPGKEPEVIRGVPSDVDLLKRLFPFYGIR